MRVGRDPDSPWVWTVGPRHAHSIAPDAPAPSRPGVPLLARPEHRAPRRVQGEQTIQTLMGKDVAPRFELIMERAPKVDEIDV